MVHRILDILVSRIQKYYIDGLVQERRNSSVLAMELRLSCINPSVYDMSFSTLPKARINLGWGLANENLSLAESIPSMIPAKVQNFMLTLKGPIPYIYGTQVWLSLCLQMS